MSYLSSENVQCERIQGLLNDNFATGSNQLDPMPALEAIIATQTQNGIASKVVDSANSKVKTVRLTYEQRALESAVAASNGRVCTTTNQTYNNYTDYSMDVTSPLNYGEKFTVEELATVCTDVPTFYAQKIQKCIDVVERAIATQTASELVLLYGKWATTVSGVTSDELVVANYVSAATKVLNPTMWSEIDLALMQTGFTQPIIVSGTQMYQAAQAHAKGCCSTTGVNIYDMFAEYGKGVLYDKRVATALADASKSIVFNAGSVALLTYNEYKIDSPAIGSNYAKMVMYSPRTGLPFDVIIKDDCGTIHINVFANTKLVGLPSDLFAVGDEYRGVKLVNKIKITNPS